MNALLYNLDQISSRFDVLIIDNNIMLNAFELF